MITVYTIAYNEKVFLQYMIDYYRGNFPNCHIVIYDNQSTDETRDIGLKNNCEIRLHDTNHQIDDFKLTSLKNNCWKNAKTDWVCIVDVDELIEINEQQLRQEESFGSTIIKTEGINLVNYENNFDFKNIKFGALAPQYNKACLFNKKHIREINYSNGCHFYSAVGNAKLSQNQYRLLHYKFINDDYIVERYKLYQQRLSDANKRSGLGSHYIISEQDLRNNLFMFKCHVAEKYVSGGLMGQAALDEFMKIKDRL